MHISRNGLISVNEDIIIYLFLLGNTDQGWLAALGTCCVLFPLETWQIVSSKLTIASVQELTKGHRNPRTKGVLNCVSWK